MYAIIETGGKQYRVDPGTVIEIEKLPVESGSEVAFNRVLAICEGDDLRVGCPVLEGAQVIGRVLEHGRGRKIRGLKYKPKVNYRKRYGHRQAFTRVVIDRIQG